ncbi:DUF4192 family protein [Rhodococcus erythropolis]|uniref:DUF4192 family protein n=1 Tax=Rhodococcus erythropolis TaxID=1833 RepID=UPI0036D88501
MQNIRLRTATDVLAAIPGLLGFVPANSVVMIALTGSPATLAFVARTDVIGADAAADYSTALEQAAATSVIWVVIGTGPVAAAGSTRSRQRSESSTAWESAAFAPFSRSLSRPEPGGSTPTARCLTSNACPAPHAISCSVVGSLRPLGRASSFRPCSPAGSGAPPKAFV